MLLLALDTSGAQVTAALHDGTAVLAERSIADARRHAELLAPALAAVLAEAGRDCPEVTGLVVGVGPGPFTGLRVGIVTGRVLGAALGVPVYGVCSLDGLAEETPRTGTFLVATDARRREVYWAAYRREHAGAPPVRVDGPHVGRAVDVPRAGRPVVGRGGVLYPAELGPARLDGGAQLDPAVLDGGAELDPALLDGGAEPLDVRAGALAALAVRALAAGEPDRGLLPPEPLYLRRPDAVEPGARKRVLQ